MKLDELFKFFQEVKKGDMLEVVLEGRYSRLAKLPQNEVITCYLDRKYCEIGEKQYNVRGEYMGKIWWHKQITREEFFEKHYNDKDSRYVCSMEFEIDTIENVGNNHFFGLELNEIKSIKVVAPKKALTYYDRAYDYANKNSDTDDCVWDAINKYKALRELNDEQRLFMHDMIASRMGWVC